MCYEREGKAMLYGNWTIKHTHCEFARTDSGKSWKAKPIVKYAETVTTEYYNNFVDSIPFFNGFMGGTCRGYRTYTKAGYLVNSVTTINPSRDTKYVDTFEFI